MKLAPHILSRIEHDLQDARLAMARPNAIKVRKSINTDCPNCYITPRGSSSNPACTTCGGRGFITTYNEANIIGHVRWNSMQQTTIYAGGFYYQGDCRIMINPSDDILDIDDRIEVDGIQLVIRNKIKSGIGLDNSVALICERLKKDATA